MRKVIHSIKPCPSSYFFFPTTAFDHFINDPQCERTCLPCYFKCIEGVYDRQLGFNYIVTQLPSKEDLISQRLRAMAYIFQDLTILDIVRLTLKFLKSQYFIKWISDKEGKIMKISFWSFSFKLSQVQGPFYQ